MIDTLIQVHKKISRYLFDMEFRTLVLCSDCVGHKQDTFYGFIMLN